MKITYFAAHLMEWWKNNEEDLSLKYPNIAGLINDQNSEVEKNYFSDSMKMVRCIPPIDEMQWTETFVNNMVRCMFSMLEKINIAADGFTHYAIENKTDAILGTVLMSNETTYTPKVYEWGLIALPFFNIPVSCYYYNTWQHGSVIENAECLDFDVKIGFYNL